MINNRRIIKTGALAGVMTIVFAIFAFRAAEWTKGLSSEFIVYGQQSPTGGGGSGSGGTNVKVVAQIAAGNYGNEEPRNYGTIIEIVNPNSTAVTVSGNFYGESGTASALTMATNLTTLPTFTGSFSNVSVAAGTVFVITVGTTPQTSPANGTTTWAKFTSSNTVSIASFFELRHSGNKGLFARVGVPASRADMTSFVIPRVREKSAGPGVAEIETGFALVNTSATSPAAVTATVKDATGATVGSKTIALGPNEHMADFVYSRFALTGEPSGRQYQYITFTSSSPTIGATALAIEGGSLTSFPVDVLQ